MLSLVTEFEYRRTICGDLTHSTSWAGWPSYNTSGLSTPTEDLLGELLGCLSITSLLSLPSIPESCRINISEPKKEWAVLRSFQTTVELAQSAASLQRRNAPDADRWRKMQPEKNYCCPVQISPESYTRCTTATALVRKQTGRCTNRFARSCLTRSHPPRIWATSWLPIRISNRAR